MGVAPQDGEAKFRRWLIAKLKQSSWSQVVGDDLETISARLLVRPEAITLAQRALDEDRRRLGRRQSQVGTGHSVALGYEFEVGFPQSIHAEWLSYCRARDMTPTSMLRSVIHTLLSGPEQPRWVGRTWRYHGKRVPMSGYVKYRKAAKKWPYVTKAKIPLGARRALNRRAGALGCTPSALVRGAIADLLEGRTRRLSIVSSAQAMWDDEGKYWTMDEE